LVKYALDHSFISVPLCFLFFFFLYDFFDLLYFSFQVDENVPGHDGEAKLGIARKIADQRWTTLGGRGQRRQHESSNRAEKLKGSRQN